MGHAGEKHDYAEVDATVEEVWNAIATGPGIDSWFMGRSTVAGGAGGTISTDMGGYVMTSTIGTWEPPYKLAYRGDGPGERFIAYDFLLEGRDGGGTSIRLVASGFLPSDDWEQEFEAMTKGGAMYFATLVAYVTHFAGRGAVPINLNGPSIEDWSTTWPILLGALGLGKEPAVGDPVRFDPPGLPPVDGVVDFVNDACLGVRTPDALYRFVQGFWGSIYLGHHLFYAGADRDRATEAWQAWVTDLTA
jgi:uncharacterized protein YndB with AHSA1/START domain